MEYWPEIAQIKSIVFGSEKLSKNIYVYLHGAGGFRLGYEAQYEYPDFASLLRDGKIDIEQPFVVACCMNRDHWDTNQLITYIDELSAKYNGAGIDVIGYSRGGKGVYGLLQSGAELSSATIVNSRLPNQNWLPRIPIHIIHAIDDQLTPIEDVKRFISQCGNDLTSQTFFEGDHFSIASIALSGIWRSTPSQT